VRLAVAVLLVSLLAGGCLPASTPATPPASTASGAAGPEDGQVVDPQPWEGIAWERVGTTGIDIAPGQHVSTLVRVGRGLMALGQGPLDRPNPDGLNTTLTVWLSADGLAWNRVPILAGVGPDSVSEGWRLASGPQGIAIAGNVCCREEGPAVWWSPDGTTWERAAFPRLRDTYLADVAAGPKGFVVIGQSAQQTRIWTSPDGLTWDEVDADRAELVWGGLADVVAVGDGFLVAGMDDRAGRDSQAALWASTGLDDFRRVAAADPALSGPDEASMSEIVPFAGGLFATGGSGTQADRIDCERLLEGGLLTAGPATALSCGWLREMTWRSVDGETWERIDPWGADGTYPPEPLGPHGRAPLTWDRVVAAGPGLVGVLVEIVDGKPGEARDIVGVWTSADARRWTRIADGPPPDDALIVDVVALDRALYALTETGGAWLGRVVP
jgi:hypothetical protein